MTTVTRTTLTNLLRAAAAGDDVADQAQVLLDALGDAPRGTEFAHDSTMYVDNAAGRIMTQPYTDEPGRWDRLQQETLDLHDTHAPAALEYALRGNIDDHRDGYTLDADETLRELAEGGWRLVRDGGVIARADAPQQRMLADGRVGTVLMEGTYMLLLIDGTTTQLMKLAEWHALRPLPA